MRVIWIMAVILVVGLLLLSGSQAQEKSETLGVVVTMGFVAGSEVTSDIPNFFFGQKQLRGSMFGDIEDFRWGLRQIRACRIKPTLDRTLPLSQASEAHRLIATNRVMGNIVLLPWAE